MTYSYAVVKRTLMSVFTISNENSFALDARVKRYHLEEGAPGAPGRGKRAAYALDDVFRLALSLRLSALGIENKQRTEILSVQDLGAAPDVWVIHRASPFDLWTVVNPGFDLSFVPARIDHITINTARLKQEIATALGNAESCKVPINRA